MIKSQSCVAYKYRSRLLQSLRRTRCYTGKTGLLLSSHAALVCGSDTKGRNSQSGVGPLVEENQRYKGTQEHLGKGLLRVEIRSGLELRSKLGRLVCERGFFSIGSYVEYCPTSNISILAAHMGQGTKNT